MGSVVPVIGFGSPDVEAGDVYEVPHNASRKRCIMVSAVAVESIYKRPPAKCLYNIT